MSVSDDDLWAAVAAAEEQLRRCQAAFHRHGRNRSDVLSSALRARSKWDTRAALTYLQAFHDDVPAVLRELVHLSLSDGWAREARLAIDHGGSDAVRPALDEIVRAELPTADGHDYLRLAELLDHVRARDMLRVLLDQAAASDDPDIREVVQYFE